MTTLRTLAETLGFVAIVYVAASNPGAAVLVAFTVGIPIVVLTARADARRREAAKRSRLTANRKRRPTTVARVKDDEPRDAIPVGYPGYRGSIRYIPLDSTSESEGA